jgi:hypothetical protein
MPRVPLEIGIGESVLDTLPFTVLGVIVTRSTGIFDQCMFRS